MGKTTIKVLFEIPYEEWEDFKRKVLKKYGRVYGFTEKAIREALKKWRGDDEDA